MKEHDVIPSQSTEKRKNSLIKNSTEILEELHRSLSEKTVRQRKALSKEKIIYQQKDIDRVLQIATAIGEISYNPHTGELINDGRSRMVRPLRRPLWESFYTSPGKLFSLRDLQKLYDSKGYYAGVNAHYMATVVSKLRQDIGDPWGSIIHNDRFLGYSFAKPESEQTYEDWVQYQAPVGEIKYDPVTFQVVVNKSIPRKLTPAMQPVWERLISKPGEIIPTEILHPPNQKGRQASVMLMHRLKKRVGEGIIIGTHGHGYALSVPEEDFNTSIQTSQKQTLDDP